MQPHEAAVVTGQGPVVWVKQGMAPSMGFTSRKEQR